MAAIASSTLSPVALGLWAQEHGIPTLETESVAGKGRVPFGKGQDTPKSKLIIFLQQYTGRTMTKTDILYSTTDHGGMFQSTVRLECMQNICFAGELCPTEKEAEHSAANEALRAHATEIALLPPKQPKAKFRKDRKGMTRPLDVKKEPMTPPLEGHLDDPKTQLVTQLQAYCKRSLAMGDIMYTVTQISGAFRASVQLCCLQGQTFIGEMAGGKQEAEQLAAEKALQEVDKWIGGEALVPKRSLKRSLDIEPLFENDCFFSSTQNPKSLLMNGLQRLLGRAMTKQDVAFTTEEIAEGQFQTTLNLLCMPGHEYSGELQPNPKMSEQMVSAMALAALAPQLEACPPPVKKNKTHRNRGPLLGNVKQEYPITASKALRKSRQRQVELEGEMMPGVVLEWNSRGFGWIQPLAELEHPQAFRHGGRIYVHTDDLAGLTSLEQGNNVLFRVYSDDKGLGAADVSLC